MNESFDINALFEDENGRALVMRAMREPLIWDDYLESPLPATMGARATFRTVEAMRMHQGVRAPFGKDSLGGSWYAMTFALARDTARIERECHESSLLWRQLGRSSDQHFVTDMRVKDTLASLQLDGLEASLESVNNVIRYERPPRNDIEKLIGNYFSTCSDLDRYRETPFSVELITELHRRTTNGVNLSGLTTKPPKAGLSAKGFDSDKPAARQLEEIARYANNEIGDPFDPPALRCLLIQDVMYSRRPFGEVSGQVGQLMSKLYALKNELPVLSVLPLADARVRWIEGSICPPVVTCDRAALDRMAEALSREGFADFTLHQSLSAQFACLLLDELVTKIEEWRQKDEDTRALLKHDPELNQRQRSIIGRALRHPGATFTIKYHQTNNAIAYATARRDLVELEQKGYLSFEVDGRTMVFKAASTLDSLIG